MDTKTKAALEKHALTACILRERAKILRRDLGELFGSNSNSHELATDAYNALAELTANLEARKRAEVEA